MDSQSVKTATIAATPVGYDGGKKIKGRKRHIMVDTLGLVMMVVVTAANISDPQYDSYHAQATSIAFEFSDILSSY